MTAFISICPTSPNIPKPLGEKNIPNLLKPPFPQNPWMYGMFSHIYH